MLSEVGVILCTLLHLFSLTHPANASGSDSGSPVTEMALAFISLGATLAGLVIVLVGTGKTLQAFRKVQHRFRMAMAGSVANMRKNRPSGCAVVVPVVQNELEPAENMLETKGDADGAWILEDHE